MTKLESGGDYNQFLNHSFPGHKSDQAIPSIATAIAVRTHNESRDVPAERLYNNSFVLIDVSTAIVRRLIGRQLIKIWQLKD